MLRATDPEVLVAQRHLQLRRHADAPAGGAQRAAEIWICVDTSAWVRPSTRVRLSPRRAAMPSSALHVQRVVALRRLVLVDCTRIRAGSISWAQRSSKLSAAAAVPASRHSSQAWQRRTCQTGAARRPWSARKGRLGQPAHTRAPGSRTASPTAAPRPASARPAAPTRWSRTACPGWPAEAAAGRARHRHADAHQLAPVGRYRDTRQASHTATHRQPSSSTVRPSGVPSVASSMMKGRRLLIVPG
jgi:hypothetical protein